MVNEEGIKRILERNLKAIDNDEKPIIEDLLSKHYLNLRDFMRPNETKIDDNMVTIGIMGNTKYDFAGKDLMGDLNNPIYRDLLKSAPHDNIYVTKREYILDFPKLMTFTNIVDGDLSNYFKYDYSKGINFILLFVRGFLHKTGLLPLPYDWLKFTVKQEELANYPSNFNLIMQEAIYWFWQLYDRITRLAIKEMKYRFIDGYGRDIHDYYIDEFLIDVGYIKGRIMDILIDAQGKSFKDREKYPADYDTYKFNIMIFNSLRRSIIFDSNVKHARRHIKLEEAIDEIFALNMKKFDTIMFYNESSEVKEEEVKPQQTTSNKSRNDINIEIIMLEMLFDEIIKLKDHYQKRIDNLKMKFNEENLNIENKVENSTKNDSYQNRYEKLIQELKSLAGKS